MHWETNKFIVTLFWWSGTEPRMSVSEVCLYFHLSAACLEQRKHCFKYYITCQFVFFRFLLICHLR